jgi:adenylate cyclase
MPTRPKQRNAAKAATQGDLSVSDLQEQLERQTRELEEAREQQAAAAEVLRVIASSPADLKPVFETILANATRLSQARFGVFYRAEGETLRVVAMRGFTAFAETAEPEEMMTVLREYHAALGTLVRAFAGTLASFTSDGLMVLFNDPLPCSDPPQQALRMAVEMRRCVGDLSVKWRRYGHDLGFGIGIAHGYATLGGIGSEERFEYTAIGTVVNLAARLCAEAASGQILVDSKVQAAIEEIADTQAAGEFALKGLHRPIRAFNVSGLRG